MKKLVTILTALTITTTVTISSVPMTYTKTVKKRKIKNHNDNEKNTEKTISLQEEKKQIKHAKQIVDYLDDQDFDFTDSNNINADGKTTWKQAFSVLESKASKLFNFEDEESLSKINLKLLNFNVAFAKDEDSELKENSIIVNNDKFIALQLEILPNWKKQWDKNQKIKANIKIKVGGKNQKEVNEVLGENIAKDIVKNDVFKDGYIAKIKQGSNPASNPKNQDLINEITKLLKKDLKLKYQEKWSLNIKNENENEVNQDDLIAGDKIFTISVTIGKDDEQVTFKIKKHLYVSVKIVDTKDQDFLLEQTGKYLIKQIDDAILLPSQEIKDIMWYKNFENQLIDMYKKNSYSINSINLYDYQTGSFPDLLKTFESIAKKDKTVLADFSDIMNWLSETTYFKKIIRKFKTLKEQFAENKVQIKFIQQIADKVYDFSVNTLMESIYENDDESFLKQDSKIILEISVDKDKKISLETKAVAFSQFTSINNYLAAFLSNVIENMLNAI